MYLRLAFAVAAHLQPDILIVDEVLAVGDAAFQRKCLGKMGDVAKQGRTVLFVSHNMGAVRSLCTRALVFSAGRMMFDGLTDEAISYYLTKTAARAGDNEGLIVFEGDADPTAELALRAIRLTDSVGQVRALFDSADADPRRDRLRGARAPARRARDRAGHRRRKESRPSCRPTTPRASRSRRRGDTARRASCRAACSTAACTWWALASKSPASARRCRARTT